VLRQLEALCQGAPLPPGADSDPLSQATSEASASADVIDGSTGSVRVRVGVLDTLMDLTGELILARNETLRMPASQRDAAAGAVPQRLKSITASLQEAVMQARMRPIGEIWNQFPRLVRDLALRCGKSVELVMEGSETELDRTILEATKAPLTHVVRNAIGHGIETPDRRIAAGKPPAGRLHLHAFHQDGLVHIEVSDDGAGLDLERIRLRAIQRQLISIEQAAALSVPALTSLLFTPGFSTAETITSLSGRGVGLDVVKTNIERIGGRVEMQTVAGKGARPRTRPTSFRPGRSR
jgi:two-component system chemotaxis sensor kinase CheA